MKKTPYKTKPGHLTEGPVMLVKDQNSIRAAVESNRKTYALKKWPKVTDMREVWGSK